MISTNWVASQTDEQLGRFIANITAIREVHLSNLPYTAKPDDLLTAIDAINHNRAIILAVLWGREAQRHTNGNIKAECLHHAARHRALAELWYNQHS